MRESPHLAKAVPHARLSVVMPVYNAGRYLKAAVNSVLQQTYGDFELICVDDGSTDDSLALLQQFQRDPRVRVLGLPHSGIVRALNEGLALAQGEFVARMDADDVAVPERFTIQLAFLDAHPEIVCVGSHARYIDTDDDPTGVWRVPLDHDAIDARHVNDGLGGGIIHPAAIIRRRTLQDVGGYRAGTDHAEDLDLFLRLAEIGKLANVPAILLNYRVVWSGISLSHRADQELQTRAVVNAARARRGLALLSASAPPWMPTEGAQLRRIVFRARAEGYWQSARKYAWRLIKNTPGARHGWQILIQASVHLWLFRHSDKQHVLRQTS